MKKRLKTSLAVILAVIMAVSVLPMGIMAQIVRGSTLHEVGRSALPSLDEVEIVSENTEKRSENEKHFVLSDGTYLAVQYKEPVHFLNDDNKWEDSM